MLTNNVWTEYELGELLSYEQPSPYIVESTDYNDKYATPVLTAGKTFILGHTNETYGIYKSLPVIIFDDFTTASRYINFPFKVKSSAMKILTPNPKLVLPKYIYYRMQIIELDHSTHKRYWIQQYSKIKVKIPSLQEQERIVAKIEELFSELDNGVETLKRTKQQLAVYRQAVLKEAFSFNSSNIIDTDLDHIISVLTDYHANGSYETLKANVTLLDTPDYAIMVRSTNYENNDFSNDVKYINKHSYDFLKKSQLFGNEVLMGKIGNAGRVYFVKKLDKPMSLAMNMFAMRFNEDIDSKYVYYYLLSPAAKRDIKKYVKGVGTPTIDKKSVKAIKIQYPQSKKLQQEIVQDIEAKLSVCDSIEQTVNIALYQAEAMRQSILKKAFEGELE